MSKKQLLLVVRRIGLFVYLSIVGAFRVCFGGANKLEVLQEFTHSFKFEVLSERE